MRGRRVQVAATTTRFDEDANARAAVALNPDALLAQPTPILFAAAALLRFASSVDTARRGEPAALGVITSTGDAGRRPDGVHVIPITALGP